MQFLIKPFKFIITNLMNPILSNFDLILIKKSTYSYLLKLSKFYWSDPFLLLFNEPERVRELIPFSMSGVRQDLFVISQLNFKPFGYFVEIGAFDGKTSSNTYLLEKKFNWNGILVEPSRNLQSLLKRNRKANLDFRAAWSVSKLLLDFSELGTSQLSTITQVLSKNDVQYKNRMSQVGKDNFLVETVSLTDLLTENNAPYEIDYVSIDTEGSELEVLEGFDFSKYKVSIFTVEHNYNEERRAKIREIMTRNHFKLIFSEISHQDDWFVSEEFFKLEVLR